MRRPTPSRLLARLTATAAAATLGLVGFAPAASPTVRPAGPFPVTVTAANGSVRFSAAPDRIISLSPTATDMLFKIGAGKQVIAVDSDSTYPKGVPTTSLSGLSPNVEAIAKRKPDLLVISYAPSGFLAQLAKLHVPVLEETAANTLADTYAQITALGEATGHRPQATAVVTSMRAQIAALVGSVPHPSHTYYYELDQTYYSATSATFIGSILGQFGLHDIADAKGATSAYPQLSSEYIVAESPQIIFLADTICCGQSAKTVAARAGWSSIAAVKSGAIVPLNDSVASQWGPRVVTLVTDVKDALVDIDAHKPV